MQIIFDGPFIMTRNLSNDCIECEHMVTGKRLIVHKNRTKPASAPQQIWREAGKIDAHLPQPITAKHSEPTNENELEYPFEETDAEGAAGKSYGYGLGRLPPQEGIVRCQPEFKGRDRPSEMETADNLEFNGWRHPTAQNSQGDVTQGYYGPMTRARKRREMKFPSTAG